MCMLMRIDFIRTPRRWFCGLFKCLGSAKLSCLCQKTGQPVKRSLWGVKICVSKSKSGSEVTQRKGVLFFTQLYLAVEVAGNCPLPLRHSATLPPPGLAARKPERPGKKRSSENKTNYLSNDTHFEALYEPGQASRNAGHRVSNTWLTPPCWFHSINYCQWGVCRRCAHPSEYPFSPIGPHVHSLLVGWQLSSPKARKAGLLRDHATFSAMDPTWAVVPGS